MKKSYFLPIPVLLVGLVLIVSFQNCSQSQFQASPQQALNEDTVLALKSDLLGISGPGNTLVTENGKIICPMVMCAAPPENCAYAPEVDSSLNSTQQNSCLAGCGKLICASGNPDATEINPINTLPPPKNSKICPAISCVAPPVGCSYVANNKLNADGCNSTCGDLICQKNADVPRASNDKEAVSGLQCGVTQNCGVDSSGDDATEINPQNTFNPKGDGTTEIFIGPKPKICPKIACAAPPEGCEYIGRPQMINGCESSCGQLICKPVAIDNLKHKICPAIGYICPVPSANCHYDNSLSADANGCSTGCGRLICASNSN